MVKLKQQSEATAADIINGLATPSVQIYGKIARGAGYGFARFGGASFADTSRVGGIYQRRRVRTAKGNADPTRHRKTILVKMRTYRPTNPQTVPQQANRSIFADAVAAWDVLTTNEKRAYNERATKKSRVGRQMFISEYMRTH